MDLSTYLKNICQFELLTAEEEQTLFRRIKDGEEEARELAVLANLRLVVNIARKYLHNKVSIEDLIQEGNAGLIKAVDKFDPEKNIRFSTYATFWIKQAVLRFLNETKNSIRYPSYIIDNISKITKFIDQYKCKYNEKPNNKTIANNLGLKVCDVERVLDLTNTVYVSIEDNYEGDDIFNCSKSIEDVLCDELENTTLINMVKNLRGKEKQVLACRFGLFGEEKQTLETVADKMNLTRERVRQIQNSVVAKLKDRLIHF